MKYEGRIRRKPNSEMKRSGIELNSSESLNQVNSLIWRTSNRKIGTFKNSRFGTNKSKSQIYSGDQLLTWEFDPGSGWTLAACLTHASRTKHFTWFSSELIVLWLSGGRVSNAWVTCLIQGDNSWKRLLIPHKRTVSHGTVWKTPVVWDGPALD